MRRMVDTKIYILIVLSIVLLLILESCGSVSGTTQTPAQNVPVPAVETGESPRNAAVIQQDSADPGLSAAAYTTPLAFALRQSAMQKVRVSKPL